VKTTLFDSTKPMGDGSFWPDVTDGSSVARVWVVQSATPKVRIVLRLGPARWQICDDLREGILEPKVSWENINSGRAIDVDDVE
jgi:hypothetical protein